MAKRTQTKRELTGTEDARRRASMLMEVWTGQMSPSQVQQALKVSAMTYYAMEHRSMQALITACEPRGKGRRREATATEVEVEKLKKEKAVLERELLRQQALVRMTRKAYGVRKEPAKPKGRNKGRTRKKTQKLLLRKAEAKQD